MENNSKSSRELFLYSFNLILLKILINFFINGRTEFLFYLSIVLLIFSFILNWTYYVVFDNKNNKDLLWFSLSLIILHSTLTNLLNSEQVISNLIFSFFMVVSASMYWVKLSKEKLEQ